MNNHLTQNLIPLKVVARPLAASLCRYCTSAPVRIWCGIDMIVVKIDKKEAEHQPPLWFKA